jgi:hypothetical protein
MLALSRYRHVCVCIYVCVCPLPVSLCLCVDICSVSRSRSAGLGVHGASHVCSYLRRGQRNVRVVTATLPSVVALLVLVPAGFGPGPGMVGAGWSCV